VKIPIRTDHESFGKIGFYSGAPDMIFIDGDHEYTAVRRDIANAKRKLAPGGLLCGHDASWPGVRAAVTELTGEFLTVPNTDIWFAL
jgi:predicted O-methyltransferase YrrM